MAGYKGRGILIRGVAQAGAMGWLRSLDSGRISSSSSSHVSMGSPFPIPLRRFPRVQAHHAGMIAEEHTLIYLDIYVGYVPPSESIPASTWWVAPNRSAC